MKNGRWYLVYTKTHEVYDEDAGCYGGASEGGAFVNIEKHVSIALEATTAKLAEVEAEERWKKIRADIEVIWANDPKGCGRNCSHKGFLDMEASNPRVVYKLHRRSKSEVEVMMKEDEDEQ